MKKALKIALIVLIVIASVITLYHVITALVVGGAMILFAWETTSFTVDTSDYVAFDYNVVWVECDKKLKSEYLPTRVYYTIENVPSDAYIACKAYESGIGADAFPVVKRPKGTESSLELDISSATLFMGQFDFNFSDEEWRSYGKSIQKQDVAKLDDEIACQLASSITAENPPYINPGDCENWYTTGRNYLNNSENHILMLRFSLKEYDGLLWVAYVIANQGQYYIRINEGLYDYQYLPCSDELTALIDSLVDEYELKTELR